MRKLTKIISLIAVFALAISIFAGCGSNNNSGAIYRTLDEIKESGKIKI